MRLFVAVQIPEHVRRAAAAVAARLKEDLGSAITARWVAPENLHLTVRFIGEVPEDTAPAVLAALQAPLPVPPFEIVLRPCGVFPRSGPPRVIWIGLQDGFRSLLALHEECNRRLLRFGFEPERRPFSAHLTLARVKDGDVRRIRRLVGAASSAPIGFPVTQATVLQSLLSPRGARYQALVEVPCKQ